VNQTRPGYTRPAIPDHRLPRQAFILADGSFLYCCNSDRIVRSESGHRDNNRWGALLLRCFSFGLDDFIWPSIVDLNLVSDLGLLGLPHLGLQLCLLEFWPVSQRRLFWSVQCHINFTRGSVIRLRGAVGGLKRAGLSACRVKSAESCMWLCVVWIRSAQVGFRHVSQTTPKAGWPHDTTNLASTGRRRVESGLCQTVQSGHIYMQAVVTRLVPLPPQITGHTLLHYHLIHHRIRFLFHIFEISDLDLFQGLEDPSGYSHSVHVMLCLVGGGGRGPTAACSRGLIWTQPVEFHCLSYSHPCMLAGYMGRKVGAWVGYTTTLRTHQLGEDSRT